MYEIMCFEKWVSMVAVAEVVSAGARQGQVGRKPTLVIG